MRIYISKKNICSYNVLQQQCGILIYSGRLELAGWPDLTHRNTVIHLKLIQEVTMAVVFTQRNWQMLQIRAFAGVETVVKYSQHPLSKTHKIPVPLTMAPTLGRTVWCLLELMWGQLSSGSHPMLSVGDQEGVMGQGLRAVK